MITFSANDRAIKELSRALRGNEKKLRQQLKIAVNATSRKTRSEMTKGVGKELATAQKNIRPTINVTQKAKATQNPQAKVTQSKTKRIGLRDFGARQTKVGVSYKTSKSTGRKVVPGAFQGPKPGVINTKTRGHVFKRPGSSRLPIAKLHGPSPWGVFVVNKLKKPIVAISQTELTKQIKRRTRFLLLKQNGDI